MSIDNYYSTTDVINASLYSMRRALMNKCNNKEMQNEPFNLPSVAIKKIYC